MEVSSLTKPSLLTILTFLVLIFSHPLTTSSSKIPKTHTNFIKKSCNTTTYPSLCVKSLTRYAATVRSNSLKLCSAALTVAIQSTRSCYATVSTLANWKDISRPEALAVKDCIGDLKDAVYQLKQTVSAMGHLGEADREFQWANAKTYASAAITDAETCVDGFLGRKVNRNVKTKIRGCVSDVEKHMSNALSLINHLY
ncbi:hypothetical protein DH2020_034090 [Rehmannia glutinosa]|uniref:Pectinesterase inhibitor domain-containing protein n=1 Tax=Rehmannia glutinosa TaxID=99300 RepID=A0ABR0VCL5_REHGL